VPQLLANRLQVVIANQSSLYVRLHLVSTLIHQIHLAAYLVCSNPICQNLFQYQFELVANTEISRLYQAAHILTTRAIPNLQTSH